MKVTNLFALIDEKVGLFVCLCLFFESNHFVARFDLENKLFCIFQQLSNLV